MVTCSGHEGLEQEHIREGVHTIASPECFSVFTTGSLDNRFLDCRVDLWLCPHPGYCFCRKGLCRWFNVCVTKLVTVNILHAYDISPLPLKLCLVFCPCFSHLSFRWKLLRNSILSKTAFGMTP